MVSSAEANKIRVFSVTEHISQFRELREVIRFGSTHSSGRIFNSFDEYSSEFGKVNTRPSGMKIDRGLEIDFIPRYENRIGEIVNQKEWDLLLCSVHEFEDGNDIETKFGPVTDRDVASERWREYLHLERMALESDFVPFKVLAHPVRASRGAAPTPPELDDLLLDLANIARKKGRALELNGSDIGYAPHLVRGLAAACSKVGCPVSLGSDAHSPKDVFRNMNEAMTLVDEFKLQSWCDKT
jgi:histidinol-phosphatase (PHP family)